MALRVGGAFALGFVDLGNPVCLTNSTLRVTARHRRRAAAMPADTWPDEHSTGGVSNIGLSPFLMTVGQSARSLDAHRVQTSAALPLELDLPLHPVGYRLRIACRGRVALFAAMGVIYL